MDSDMPERPSGPDDGEETQEASPKPTEVSRPTASAGAGVPERIGQYRIKGPIASGGMGTVYEARQEKPRRTVAIKLMRAGITSRSALRRFEYESQLLARLRHPGIAQVYDAGTHRDGPFEVPYFAMEYIVGAKPITDYVKSKGLGTRDRMKLFSQVCDAVHHGHQKGIIHRDLKPSNILVDSSGQVKIIDFGVARATDSDMAMTTLQTDVGQLLGTVQYMSPEQCAADPHDIDTRSDVYALGVVFYEMLCEHLPYDVKGTVLHEATRVIREQEPTRLSTINKSLRGDVETIALKALEKERDRRYQSTSDFQADIQRYLNNEPITARRASFFYTLTVAARRNRAAFIATVAIMMTLVAATVVSTTLYFRAQRAESEALESAELSRQEGMRAQRIQDFVVNMLGAVHPSQAKGREVTVAEVLEQAAAKIGSELADEPEVEIGVRQAIAGALNGLGRFEDEQAQWETIVELSRGLEGPDSKSGLRAEMAVALSMYQAGQDEEAMERMRALAPRIESAFGRESGEFIHNQNELGNAMRSVGQAEQAQPILETAIEISTRVVGREHDLTATGILNLGWVYSALGRYVDAEPLFLEGVVIREKLLGRENPWSIRPKSELAKLYLDMNRYDDAERWSRDALEAAREVLPKGHPDLHWALGRHGRALEGLGRLSEAEQDFLELERIYAEEFGSTTTDAAATLMSLGRVAGKMGETQRQREYVQRSLAAYRECADQPDATVDIVNACAYNLLTVEPADLRDPSTAVVYAERAIEKGGGENTLILDTLALALYDSGRFDRAIEIQRRAVELAALDYIPQSGTIIHRFGDFLKAHGDPDVLEPVLRSVWQKRKDAFGELDNRTLVVLTFLGMNLNKVEKYDQAVTVNEEIVAATRKKHEVEHPELAQALGNLAATLVFAERPAEAEPYLRECIDMYGRLSGESSFGVGNFRSWLGRSLGMLHRFDEGARELTTAYEVLSQASDSVGTQRAARAAGWLAELYEQWDAAQPGMGYDAKAAQWRR